MIVSQKIGKSFMGALSYNLKKLNHPDPKQRAEILDMSFVSLDKNSIRAQVEVVRLLKPALKRYVYHTSLNFSKQEANKLDNEKLLAIAREYLTGMGFTDNQYLIFRHHDADHPHLHLLVNRITFDGKVVSDSNNYKRSEAILRNLEQHYNLIAVKQSNHIAKQQDSDIAVEPNGGVSRELSKYKSTEQYSQVTVEQDSRVAVEQYIQAPLKAPTKSEVEMVVRTGKPSDKMVLQKKLERLLTAKGMTLPDFIIKCEQEGIQLLFNQASTGRISGVTYFSGDFKSTGKALGNRFKWSELIKQVNYEQDRDCAAVSHTSERTKGIYDDIQSRVANAQARLGNNTANVATDAAKFQQSAWITGSDGRTAAQTGEAACGNGAGDGESAKESATDVMLDYSTDRFGDWRDAGVGYIPDIEISDDIDDEAILGRNRRRQKQARTNQQ
jgi:hypothetical protein